MNEKERKLLIMDLCARLPYGVKIFDEQYDQDELLTTLSVENGVIIASGDIGYGENGSTFSSLIKDCKFKPYLRPLNTITDTEVSRAIGIITGGVSRWSERDKRWYYIVHDPSIGEIESDFDLDYFAHGYYGIDNMDFLNSHHFDYRGLIGMGLALEAPEGMYEPEKII